MAQSLEGNWREELLCNLRQSRELYECYQRKIAECDTQIEAHLRTFDRPIKVAVPPLPTPKRRPKNARRDEPPVELHTQLYRLSGVDFTRIDGIEVRTAPNPHRGDRPGPEPVEERQTLRFWAWLLS